MKKVMSALILLLAVYSCTAQNQNPNWSWGPVIPIPKSSWATAAKSDAVITVGGTFWSTNADGVDVKTWLSTSYRLNIKDMKWESLPDYPQPLGYGFAAFVKGKLYVVGGRGGLRGNAETFILDFSAEVPEWYTGPSLPQPRWQHKGGVIDGVIYIIGGTTDDPSKENATQLSPDILALDTHNLKKGWQFITDIPASETMWQFAAACDGKLYIFGGVVQKPDMGERTTSAGTLRITENNQLPLVPQTDAFSFDIVNSEWKVLQPLPTPKCLAGCVAIDDRYIFIAGGVDLVVPGSQTPDSRPRINFSTGCWFYDTVRDTYKPASPLLKAVCDEGLVCIDGLLYAIGGEGNAFKTRTDLVQIGKLR